MGKNDYHYSQWYPPRPILLTKEFMFCCAKALAVAFTSNNIATTLLKPEAHFYYVFTF